MFLQLERQRNMLPAHLKPYFKSLEELLEYRKCLANLSIGNEVVFNWSLDKSVHCGIVVVVSQLFSRQASSSALVRNGYQPCNRIVVGIKKRLLQGFWWGTNGQLPSDYFGDDFFSGTNSTIRHPEINTFKEFRSLTFPDHRITKIIKESRES